MSEIKLKPCPFCGGGVEHEVFNDGFFTLGRVECKQCGVMMTTPPTSIIEAWNTRADADIRAKAIDDCMNEIREYAINAYDCEIDGKLARGNVGWIQVGLYEAYERLQMLKEEIAEQMKEVE